MSPATSELIAQLNMMLRLTTTEAATARSRVAQATTDATREELLANAGKCDERATAIRAALTDLGGIPDVLGIAIAKALSVGKLPLEQSLPVTEALLTDLALEHQLFDRARLVKVLAHESKAPRVVKLAERLENAHGETIQWLFTVLAETAIGGPAALAPTPAQTAAGVARSTVTYGSTLAAKTVNRTAAQLAGLSTTVSATVTTTAHTVQARANAAQAKASSTVDGQLDRVKALAKSATKVLTAGRDAGLATAEDEAAKHGAAGTAKGLQATREDLGAVDALELPVGGYDTLNTRQAEKALGELTTAHDVRTVLAYETAHKARPAVLAAATKRISDIAGQLVNS